MKRWVEQAYPWVGGVAVGLAIFWLVDPATSADTLGSLASNLLTVSSISVGFLGTALAILLSMPSTKYVRQIRETTAWSGLIGYMTCALHVSFFFVVACVCFVFMDLRAAAEWKRYAVAIWGGLGAIAALASYRTIGLFAILLEEDSKSKKAAPQAAGK